MVPVEIFAEILVAATYPCRHVEDGYYFVYMLRVFRLDEIAKDIFYDGE